MLLAMSLRAGFFVGLVSGDPQDDGIYYGNALALYREGPKALDLFRNLPPDFLADPIDQFHVRPMVTYPIAASFAIFGPGELPAALWGLVCSMLTVLVVYRLGSRVHDRSVGLFAALLCAFYPLEVINGTRILSDVQVGLFTAIGLLLLVEASARRRLSLYGVAGAAAAGAYLANARGLVILIVLAGGAALLAARRHASWRAPFYVIGGFAAVFCIEGAIYYLRTGDPLLSYHIQSGASYFKYLHEPVTSVDWGWIRVSYTNGEPLGLSRSVLRMTPGPTDQFGFFFVLFLVSIVFSLVTRRNLLLVAVAVGLFLYLEFGPVRLAIDWATSNVHYMMMFKQDRFLLILTAPLVVLAGYFLRSMAARSRLAVAVVLIALFATSIAAMARTRGHYRSGLHDLRVITEHVRSHPDRIFFGDLWAIEHLTIFTRHGASNLRVLDVQGPHDLEGACVILGGSRGVELLADYVASTLPPFVRQILYSAEAPAGWTLVTEIEGPRDGQRHRDLRLYCVEPQSRRGTTSQLPSPDCKIVNTAKVPLPTRMVPVRTGPELHPTVYATVPFPVPWVGDSSCIQVAVVVACQSHGVVTVNRCVPSLPDAGNFIESGVST
jgi:MFS family permease